MPTSISEPFEPLIREHALALGFEVCGFASVEAPWPAAARLHEFIDLGRHGDMDWMASTAERRAHPRAMWSEARSAVVLGLNYGPEADPLAILDRRDRGAISVYAQGDDYHELIKGRLKTLGYWMAETMGGQVRAFVDTAPLMEKPLAQTAGVGWQGKHTNLVSRAHGSWLFLGALLTDLVLEPDAPEADHCGSCRACLDVCPTGAFPAPYQLDARACISYLTIEHKGPIPRRYRQALGNRIYGCDDCLAVCPWNKYAAQAREGGVPSARGPDRAAVGGARRPGRRGVPRPVPQEPGQAHRPRPLREQRALRRRQLRRAGLGGDGARPAGRSLAAGARRGGVGAGAAAFRG